ncbi:MAG: carboxypeptidase regulatory-like domain-containing protein, partial [Erysipelotrichia bacterium]|nr:carboxypeptidase regulatory-like domain-containing protein [Erysipelotrichia bacterium]
MCNFLKGRSALNKLKLITRLLRTHKPGNPVFLIVLFFALTVILTTGCGGTSSSKNLSAGPSPIVDDLESGRIKGTVTSSVTGNIIKGAIVETFEKQAVAGEDGAYLLGPLPAGDYRVIARASGYEPIVKDDVRVIAGRITENVDYKLNTQVASYSPDFAVLAVLPYLGTDGDEVTIYCRGCGSEKGRVTFNGKDAT